MAEFGKTNNNILEIRMLGDFSLRRGDSVLSGERIRGKQIWTLLEYIMVNRHREISMDGLMQALWQNDEAEDPANALKNLAYRLRTILKQSLGSTDTEYIVYKHGVYVWNEAIPCIIDVDAMEAAYKESKHPETDRDQVLACCRKIIELYKGNFMPQAAFKEWIVPLTVHYQRIYMETVATYCEMLIADGLCKEAEVVCRAAIAIDPFIEENHALLLRALIDLNQREQAIEHYRRVDKLFRDELGIKPAAEITALYKEAAGKMGEQGEDLSQVKLNLKENLSSAGAIYCNYEEFKMFYRLEARAAQRSGKSIVVVLLTVKEKGDKALSKKYTDETLEKIKDSIVSLLRKDDIVTGYGRAQFLLLLSNLKYENTEMILNRLVHNINSACAGRSVEVKWQIESLDPVEMEERHVVLR